MKKKNKKIKNNDWTGWLVGITLVLFAFILGLIVTLIIIPDLKSPLNWKRKPVEVVVQEKVYSEEEFIKEIAEKADAGIIFPPKTIELNKNDSVSGANCQEASIELYKSKQEFTELLPDIEEFQLTVRYITPESRRFILIPCYKCRYTDFAKDYKQGDMFEIKYVKYKITFDGKTYLITNSGKFVPRR